MQDFVEVLSRWFICLDLQTVDWRIASNALADLFTGQGF